MEVKTEVKTTNLSPRAKEDYDMVLKAIDGCQKAYAVLMERYKSSIFHMMLKMVNNRDDADDLTLEAFGKAFNNGQCGAKPCSGQSQSDLELYWKILVLPDLWVTPGLQMLFNPSLFEGVQTPGLVWVPTLRSRVFF